VRDSLHHLSDAQRSRLLELTQEVVVPAGSVILEEGAPAADVVLILEGTVRIEKNYLGARIPVDEIDAGQLVGEMSYLLGTNATATVVAQGDVRFAVIPKAALDGLLHTDASLAAALFRSWAEILAHRLNRRTGDVVGMHWSWG
jgi:extracellular factor (EF) 3-hydroxypalmitic acid methyl ester biosynthesis protein